MPITSLLFPWVMVCLVAASTHAREPTSPSASPSAPAPTSTSAPSEIVCRLQFEREERKHEIAGKILLEAQDGGLLFLAADNVLWDVQPSELRHRTPEPPPLKFLSGKGLEAQVLRELPPGFQTYSTRHYLICYNTSRAYAQWCAGLFERLYKTFHGFWKKQGLTLHEPDTLLVALVFNTPDDYSVYAKKELGENAQQVIGFYSLHTNRIAMYDLTGVAEARQGQRMSSSALVDEILSAPDAERTVATVIHEATHQLAFNCGMQSRIAEVPIWLSEGLAMYFETPDLDSRKGWRTLGGINGLRWNRFQNLIPDRPSDALQLLVRDDERFRAGQIEDAYAEAWAFCHFLIRRYPKEFVSYTQTLAHKKPLAVSTPEQRLAEFRTAFGQLPEGFDSAMVQYISELR